MKTNFKKTLTALAAGTLCAVSMCGTFSASAAEISLSRAELKKAKNISAITLSKLESSYKFADLKPVKNPEPKRNPDDPDIIFIPKFGPCPVNPGLNLMK